jgi:hypothetical protein
MKYQLVLQFAASSTDDFDRVIAFETKLAEHFGTSSMVDGHDFGSGECNVFVHTDEPAVAFEHAHHVAKCQGLLDDLRAAYREVGAQKFEVVWPTNLTLFSVK